MESCSVVLQNFCGLNFCGKQVMQSGHTLQVWLFFLWNGVVAPTHQRTTRSTWTLNLYICMFFMG